MSDLAARTAGLVLAGGASQRMGSAKALLRCPDGLALAVRQAGVMRAGGCAPVAVVLGAGAEDVRRGLPAELATVKNERWAQGRATSLQAGIAAFPGAAGFLFLPVDAAGVRAETIGAILAAAERGGARAWRPVHRGEKGNVLWVSRDAGRELLGLSADARVDEWAKPMAKEIEVEDPGILRNVNTPEEWRDLLGSGQL